MTPDEAKTKWCPFARSYDFGSDGTTRTVNRDADGAPDISCLCIADRCMMWQWLMDGNTQGVCGLTNRALGA